MRSKQNIHTMRVATYWSTTVPNVYTLLGTHVKESPPPLEDGYIACLLQSRTWASPDPTQYLLTQCGFIHPGETLQAIAMKGLYQLWKVSVNVGNSLVCSTVKNIHFLSPPLNEWQILNCKPLFLVFPWSSFNHFVSSDLVCDRLILIVAISIDRLEGDLGKTSLAVRVLKGMGMGYLIQDVRTK